MDEPEQKLVSDYAAALGEPTRHNGWVRCGKSGGWIQVGGFDFNTDEWNWNLKTPTLVRLLNKVLYQRAWSMYQVRRCLGLRVLVQEPRQEHHRPATWQGVLRQMPV